MIEDIVSELEKLKTDVDKIIQLLRSKHNGSYFPNLRGRDIPHIILDRSDIESIYRKLYAYGSRTQTILAKIQKTCGDEILNKSQQILDSHALALKIVASLKFGQIPISNAGVALEPLLAFNNSILNTIGGLSVLSSYDSTGKGFRKSSKKERSSYHLSRKSQIIITIILGILGVSGLTFEISFNGVNFINNSNNVHIITNYGNLILTNDALNSESLLDGEHDNTFTSKTAGFTIQKPDSNWFFTDPEKYGEKIGLGTDPTYIGGIIVSTDRPDLVSIKVIKLGSENSDLSKFIDEQIVKASKTFSGMQTNLTRKYISPDGNWAAFEGYVSQPSNLSYGRQILHKYNDKLYIIQTTSEPPEILSTDMKTKLNKIVESIRILN